jgi:hypothetical protein
VLWLRRFFSYVNEGISVKTQGAGEVETLATDRMVEYWESDLKSRFQSNSTRRSDNAKKKRSRRKKTVARDRLAKRQKSSGSGTYDPSGEAYAAAKAKTDAVPKPKRRTQVCGGCGSNNAKTHNKAKCPYYDPDSD